MVQVVLYWWKEQQKIGMNLGLSTNLRLELVVCVSNSCKKDC